MGRNEVEIPQSLMGFSSEAIWTLVPLSLPHSLQPSLPAGIQDKSSIYTLNCCFHFARKKNTAKGKVGHRNIVF